MEDILSLLIPATFFGMLVLERIFPARPLPRVRWWVLKGIGFFVMTGILNAILPALVAGWTARLAPLDLTRLGTIGGAVVAFALSDYSSYWLHRAMHRHSWFWRWTHQMHHSAERVDIAGAVLFHPFDIALSIAVTTAAVALLGVSPDAAALAGFMSFFYGMFQHLNVRTPTWLGYLIQRPEAHSVHHARGVHAYNFGNFPLWDLLHGTFRNPAEFSDEAGFWDGASRQIGRMLLGRDVGAPS